MRLTPLIRQQRGSIVLVALCFLAVLGIALASYLAVCHQAVKLSNREYQRSISLQLAESGIEQSLWSFNWNNWSSPWDTTTIPGSAIRHITFPANKYNNGVAGSIMLRVDRYDATVWNNFTTYNSSATKHDLVWYRGVWYQCTAATIPSGTTPPLDAPSLWASAPAPWNASANYQPGNIVLFGGAAYVCTNANINTVPTDTLLPAKWNPPIPIGNWDSAINYTTDKVVSFGGMSYRCIAANSNMSPPDANYWVGVPTIYAEGIATPPDNAAGAIRTQLRAGIAPVALFTDAIAATSTASLTSTNASGIVDSYNFPVAPYPSSPPNSDPKTGFSAMIAGGYNSGTAVSISGGTVQGYISAPSKATSPYPLYANLAGTLKGTPAATGIDFTRLLRDPYIPQFDLSLWDANKVYRPNDIVLYASDHYVCIVAPTNHQNPSDLTYWKPNIVLPTPTADIDLPLSPSDQVTSVYVIRDNPFNLTHKITIKGPVALFIESDLQISAGGSIYLPATGYPYARAQIQFTGRLRVHSAGTIDNQTKDPKKLILIGSAVATPGNHTFYSPTKFYGTIYLPYATSALTFANPSGLGDPELFGAISAQKVTFNSPAILHYDTSLRTTVIPGIDAPFAVTEWRELTDPTEKIVLP